MSHPIVEALRTEVLGMWGYPAEHLFRLRAIDDADKASIEVTIEAAGKKAQLLAALVPRLAREPSREAVHSICGESCKRCPSGEEACPDGGTLWRGCYNVAVEQWRACIDALLREVEGE